MATEHRGGELKRREWCVYSGSIFGSAGGGEGGDGPDGGLGGAASTYKRIQARKLSIRVSAGRMRES